MLYKAFNVVGQENVTVLDAGLVSEVGVPRHLNALLLNVSVTNGNVIEGWIGNKRIVEIPDWLFDNRVALGVGNEFPSTTKMSRLPVDIDIPPGQAFKVGMRSAAVGSSVTGSYEYTETA
ncbi:hypothetical protein ES705_50104 [subsurface metagenome]